MKPTVLTCIWNRSPCCRGGTCVASSVPQKDERRHDTPHTSSRRPYTHHGWPSQILGCPYEKAVGRRGMAHTHTHTHNHNNNKMRSRLFPLLFQLEQDKYYPHCLNNPTTIPLGSYEGLLWLLRPKVTKLAAGILTNCGDFYFFFQFPVGITKNDHRTRTLQGFVVIVAAKSNWICCRNGQRLWLKLQ